MRSLARLLLYLALFTAIFFGLRAYGAAYGYDIPLLIANLGGLTYLYETVGTMFAVFAAFVIVSEAQDWNTLVAAAKKEVRELKEMLIWSRQLSDSLQGEYRQGIRGYLEKVTGEEWSALQKGRLGAEDDTAVEPFHDLLVAAHKENADVGSHLYTSFEDLLDARGSRIEYSYQPLPQILYFAVVLVDFSVMGLSLLIGVENVWLDYLFTLSIVTLGTVVLMVIRDLDNPLQPGEWSLTSADFDKLLHSLEH